MYIVYVVMLLKWLVTTNAIKLYVNFMFIVSAVAIVLVHKVSKARHGDLGFFMWCYFLLQTEGGKN